MLQPHFLMFINQAYERRLGEEKKKKKEQR